MLIYQRSLSVCPLHGGVILNGKDGETQSLGLSPARGSYSDTCVERFALDKVCPLHGGGIPS